MAAIMSPTKASRDTRNNALSPPPPLPSLIMTRDHGEHCSDSRLRQFAVTGLHGLASSFDAVRNTEEVVSDQMLALSPDDLKTDGQMSLSCSQYTNSRSTPLVGTQSAYISQRGTPIMKTDEFSPVSLSSGHGDLIAMPFDCGRPKRSSSSSPTSSWAMPVAESESDSSIASDEEHHSVAPTLGWRNSSVVDAQPSGPCSRTWSLPPVCRIDCPPDLTSNSHGALL